MLLQADCRLKIYGRHTPIECCAWPGPEHHYVLVLLLGIGFWVVTQMAAEP